MAKTHSNSGVICPHCGYVNGDAFEWVKERPTESECGYCGKTFVCWAEYDVTYYAREVDNALRDVLKEALAMPRTTLTDGSPVTADHRDLKPNGQQKGYVVLAEEERAKGFVRPVRDSYVHLKCGTVTRMGQALAETYARDPYFYSGTFCCGCGKHFPVGEDGEFEWVGTSEKVGT